MHPGPINRGVELSSDAADSQHSIILDQVENGVAVRMAVLYLLGRYKINIPYIVRGSEFLYQFYSHIFRNFDSRKKTIHDLQFNS